MITHHLANRVLVHEREEMVGEGAQRSDSSAPSSP